MIRLRLVNVYIERVMKSQMVENGLLSMKELFESANGNVKNKKNNTNDKSTIRGSIELQNNELVIAEEELI